MDNDGWPDILICNGHVYPEVEQLKTEAGYAAAQVAVPEPAQRTLRGRFAGAREPASPIPLPPAVARLATSTMTATWTLSSTRVNGYPQLLRCDLDTDNNWIKVRTIGTKSNRSGIGARLKCVTKVPGESKPHEQIDEVRSGGGYFSQNDLRVHFGIGKPEKVDLLEIRWPSGQVDIDQGHQSQPVDLCKRGCRNLARHPTRTGSQIRPLTDPPRTTRENLSS